MKNLFLSVVVFISANAFAQRNAQDSLNLVKVQEVKHFVKEKLSGTVTEQDVLDFVTYIYDSKSTTPEFQYFDLLNPDLYGLNTDPYESVDIKYLNQAFTQLKNKKNVRVEFIGIEDYYNFYDDAHKKSDYLLTYKIHFVNATSFGPNTSNSVDLRIDVINGKVSALFYVLEKV
jgi:hypothetical protein